MRRSVTRLVGEGLVEASYLASAPRRASDDRLMILVAGIRIANPALELRQIGAQLQGMHERTPRGGTTWSASSVKSLLDRAIASGVYQRLLGSRRVGDGRDVRQLFRKTAGISAN